MTPTITQIDLTALSCLSDRSLGEAIESILHLLRKVTGMESTMLLTIDYDADPIQQVATHVAVEPEPDVPIQVGDQFAWDEGGCRLLRAKGENFSSDMQQEFPEFDLGRSIGLRAYLSMPIEIGPERTLVGTLCAMNPEPMHLDEDAIAIGRLFAVVIARVLDRERQLATLKSDAERSHQKLLERTEQLAQDEHRIKTGLAVVSGWLTMLDEGLGGKDALRAISVAKRRTDQLQDELRDMILHWKSQLADDVSGHTVDLAPIVRSVVGDCQGMLGDRTVQLDLADAAWVRGEASVVRDIVEHLLENVARHGGRSVLVSVSAGLHESVLSVRDWNRSPSEDLLRGPTTSPDGRGGTGMGLSTVSALAAALGARCTASAGDFGTRYSVHFATTSEPVRL